MSSSKIRVAIIGGGLGGTALMNSVMRYDHIDAHIYEAKDTFKERGASVGLAGNAQRALKMMGLESAIEHTGAVPVNGARAIMGEGPNVGDTILVKDLELVTVHRAALLRELVGPIPEDRMHVNKKLMSIDSNSISFEDGSVVTADVIIGADGIHSSVRQYVLRGEPESLEPVHAGIFDCRTVLPFKDAMDKIGPEILKPEEPRQTIYFGDGSLLFYDYIEEGSMICVLAAGITPSEWDRGQWKQQVSRKWLLERYRSWPAFATDMINALCGDQDEISAFIEWESAPSSKIHNDNMCLIGDAAHATTPWQGAGLGQALEDALILQAVLRECRSIDDVPHAFQVYDEMMRPRGQEVIESSHGMANICLGKEGLDGAKLGRAMVPRWDFIHDWDTEQAVIDASTKTRTLVNRSGAREVADA